MFIYKVNIHCTPDKTLQIIKQNIKQLIKNNQIKG